MTSLRFAGLLTLALLASGTARAQGDSPKPPRSAEAEAAAKLVEDIANAPAIYNQACSMHIRDSSLEVAVSLTGRSSYSEQEISAAQFEQLRRQREEVIRVLEAWLGDSANAKEDPETSWANPARSKMLMMVDLNAASCLPRLKTLAESLLKAYASTGSETTVDWTKVNGMDTSTQKRIYDRAAACDRLGDVLSVIVTLLRQEKFEPLLKSDFEKDAEAQIARRRKETWCVEIDERIRKNGGEVEAKDRPMIITDPVIGQPFTMWAYPTVKVTAETAAQILKWVDEYAKLPADQRLGAKGMSAWPVNR